MIQLDFLHVLVELSQFVNEIWSVNMSVVLCLSAILYLCHLNQKNDGL